ncbi:PLP-dependent transferase [Paracoccus aerodenitrificans]|uniref:PLP-dependent transferase n=1 Tax=Paracoccus aerodenitrificans TaxID=3017781 RepID=UPI0022F0F8DA|nr:PLP-dependent transferase [Paracoccus aerodenitrificans]WBU63927.1 PLP-dependent transferase [Paracoccus aerodenitrificans]
MTQSYDDARLITAHDEESILSAVVPPIVQTSLFTFDSFDEMLATYRGEIRRPVYSRGLNPTVRQFEEKIARLEKTDDAIAFASGMAAISAAVLGNVSTGDRVLAIRNVYPDAFRLFGTHLARMGIQVDYVDGTDPDAVAHALPGAKLLYLESATSWMIEPLDIARLSDAARHHGAMTVVDNSWPTPVFQNPITLGADLVLHSASKYIGGHSDVVAGVVAGPEARIAHLRDEIYPYLGGRIAPMDAWLLLRGLRTLPLRMAAHQESALEIARRLQDLDCVAKVMHPGLAPLPPGLRGTTGLFSVEFHDRIDIRSFCDALKLFRLGVSWGGHESLIVPGEVMLSQQARPNAAREFGISAHSVRLHVGLEGTEALWTDLKAAISAADKSAR